MTEAFMPPALLVDEEALASIANADAKTRPAGNTPQLPSHFWDSRPALQHIRQLAWSRCAPADAVLYGTLARLSAMLHHGVRFDTGIGKAAPNLFVAVCGASGAGKSTSADVVADSIDIPRYLQDGKFLDGVGIGSGEGMAEAFMGTVEQETGEVDRKGEPKVERVRTQVRHNVYVVIDEGETLTKMIDRAGATIGPAVRSAWTGATLGQSNARAETTRIVPRGEYAMGMLIGYQRDTAQALLSDIGPGTPQRFLWSYATDREIPDRPPRDPGPLPIELEFGFTPVTGTVEYADEIRDELWARKLSRSRGEVEDVELDSHEPLMRAKIAGLLAILDGRKEVTTDDWKLSLIVWETSCAVRDDLVAYGARQAQEDAERRAEAARENAVRTAAEVGEVGARVDRLAHRLADKVVAEAGMTSGAARRMFAHRDRALFEAAKDRAVAEKLIRETASGLLPPLRAV